MLEAFAETESEASRPGSDRTGFSVLLAGKA